MGLCEQIRKDSAACGRGRLLLCLRAAAAVGALGLVVGPARADVPTGIEAWEAGDHARAVAAWEAPAAAGDADALFLLAQAYRLGRGVAADGAKARAYYAAASAKGHRDASDHYGLILFHEGQKKQAMPLLMAAADRGDPPAQYLVALAHYNGDFATRDWVRAYALMTLAHQAGLPQAAAPLVEMDKHIPKSQREQATRLAARLAASVEESGVIPPNAAGSSDDAADKGRFVGPVPDEAIAGRWRVQLGAFAVVANAEKLWRTLADHPALVGTRKALVPGKRLTRLHAVGFTSAAAAQAACDALLQEGQACLVVEP